MARCFKKEMIVYSGSQNWCNYWKIICNKETLKHSHPLANNNELTKKK